MKIQLMKPVGGDWTLVAFQATVDEIAVFDDAIQRNAYDANADQWCRKLLESPQGVRVWTLSVEAFLAVYVAFEVGKALGKPVELDNIGDTVFEMPQPDQ